MITLDFSQLLIAGCLEDQANFQKGGDVKQMEQIARHRTLMSILMYKKKYSETYGETVLCCDGDRYWRTEAFSYYKGKRKADKKESTIDWGSIHSISDQLKEEFREVLPYKLILVPQAEADDVIAVLSEYLQTQELITSGLEDRPQEIKNVSADHDYRQLYLRFRNYSQFSPIQKKEVGKPENTFLIEKCIRGDAGDGVPSVLCPDDFFINKEAYGRAPPVTAKVVEKFMKGEGLTDLEKERLERNKMLIDFSYIPIDVKNKIVHAYRKAKPTATQNDLFNYFITNRCRALTQDIAGFF